MDKPTLLKKIENEKRQQIIDLNQRLHQECEARVRAERELEDAKRYLAEEQQQYRQERKARNEAERERNECRESLKEVLRQVVPSSDDWWCPTCEESLSPARVTYQECCDECGTYLGYQDAEWIEKARRALGGE